MALSKKPLLFLIFLLSIFGPISTDMYLVKLSDMIVQFNTTQAIMTMSLYLFLFTLAISVLFMGPLSDKYGRRKILTIAMTIYVTMSLACSFLTFNNVWIFITFRILQAIGGGGALAISMALVKDFFKGDELKSVVSLTVAMSILGPILAPVLGNLLVKIDGSWEPTFWGPAAIGAMCLVLALFLPPEIPVDRYNGSVFESVKNVGRMAKNKTFTVFMIMSCIFSAGQLAYVAVSSYIYHDTFMKDDDFFTVALAATLIMGVVFMKIIMRFEEKIGSKRMLWIVIALGIGTTIPLIVINEWGENMWIVFVICMIPLVTLTMVARSFGFNILLREYDGDNGAVSSLLNFIAFMFCCTGMVLATALPWPDNITAIGGVTGMCCVVYVVMWAIFRKSGYNLKYF